MKPDCPVARIGPAPVMKTMRRNETAATTSTIDGKERNRTCDISESGLDREKGDLPEYHDIEPFQHGTASAMLRVAALIEEA